MHELPFKILFWGASGYCFINRYVNYKMLSNLTEFGSSNTCNLSNIVGLNFHKYAITWYVHLFLTKFLINTTLFTAFGMNKVKILLGQNLLQELGHFLLFAHSLSLDSCITTFSTVFPRG